VVYRASWPDEERVSGTLADICEKVQGTQIERTALILVGSVLDADAFSDSSLYAKTHRQAV
jgi:precorrin-4/cobalt-precorrin-4 C11-methyltransferase